MKQFLLILCFACFCSCTDDENKLNNNTIDPEILLELVNNIRESGCECGDEKMPPVGKLIWDDMLSEAAQKHSDYMFKTNTLSHIGKNNSKIEDRVENAGYLWRSLGENIASGFENEADVIEAWLNSPSHCKNIMGNDFKEMGVARTDNYWTQVFGSKR